MVRLRKESTRHRVPRRGALALRSSRVAPLVFLGLLLSLLSFSPGAIRHMGYTGENMDAVNAWLDGTPVTWPRHGVLELIVEAPFLVLGRMLPGGQRGQDLILSLEPVLLTALLCTLLFVWIRRITSDAVWAYVLTLMAAMTTMLWPYAYIGLETTQSLAVLAAGYLALERASFAPWRRMILLALAAGFAIAVKSNGLHLLPAVAYILYVYCREGHPRGRIVTLVGVVAALYAAGAYTRSLSLVWQRGMLASLKEFGVEPLMALFNAIAALASINKGLLIYCPILLLSIVALPRARQTHRHLVVFAVLTLLGLLGGTSLVFFWSDETWGPRYLHAAIAPLILCIAAARRGVAFRVRRELPAIVLSIAGLAVSALGVFVYYGAVYFGTVDTKQPTLEALQYDPAWNHVRVNLRLAEIWYARDQNMARPWPPPPHWNLSRPPPSAGPPTDLRKYAAAQPILLRLWGQPKRDGNGALWFVYFNALAVGLFLLTSAARRASAGAGAP